MQRCRGIFSPVCGVTHFLDDIILKSHISEIYITMNLHKMIIWVIWGLSWFSKALICSTEGTILNQLPDMTKKSLRIVMLRGITVELPISAD